MITDLKLTSSLPSTPIVFASLNVPVPLIHSTRPPSNTSDTLGCRQIKKFTHL